MCHRVFVEHAQWNEVHQVERLYHASNRLLHPAPSALRCEYLRCPIRLLSVVTPLAIFPVPLVAHRLPVRPLVHIFPVLPGIVTAGFQPFLHFFCPRQPLELRRAQVKVEVEV